MPPDDLLASEEQVEAARDSLIEEAILTFFAVSLLMDAAPDGPEIDAKVRGWLKRAGNRLWDLYYQSALKTARDLGIYSRLTLSSSFTPREEVVQEVIDTVKELRRSLAKRYRAERKGEPSPTPLTKESAGLAAASEAHGLLSMDMAEKLKIVLDGSVVNKTWMSRGDTRVRPLHRRLHARTKKVGEDFWRWPATGQVLRYPGDFKAPLEATVNCRCFLLLSLKKKS